jgi:D-beta-D-heptose 7-phosphate kinase/D-beta-D-heptose 1-phosphate adenosyltransferase
MSNVVYVYMCGDILHAGHLVFLNNAAALGDKLIVGVLTNEAVMEKKPKPIIDFEDRIFLISSLKCVDLAIPQLTYSPMQNLHNIKPDILVESSSHDKDMIETEKECMDEWGGRVFVVPYFPGKSSSDIKSNIKKGDDNVV